MANKNTSKRPSNDEFGIVLDTSPGTTLCARLSYSARKREVTVEGVKRKVGWIM
ncbi:hypothetical protein DPMN_046281 [Dreissena polymorpha]|uniref:Uncharacterized protein n=1 Tax=Dreissena polymorpha TaxID=45954 RepID=A0A9D4I0R2_DREPO|nr:hypothetical protein DPMN_046281 [Dreissena polymorpha]